MVGLHDGLKQQSPSDEERRTVVKLTETLIVLLHHREVKAMDVKSKKKMKRREKAEWERKRRRGR